jgi:hypothetical protein
MEAMVAARIGKYGLKITCFEMSRRRDWVSIAPNSLELMDL